MRPPRSVVRIAAAGLVALMSVGVAAPAAHATPADDLIDRAAQLQRQLLANGTMIDALSEQYNGAVLRRDQARQQIDQDATMLTTLTDRHTRLGADIRRHVATLYRGSAGASPLADVSEGGVVDVRRRRAYASVVARRDQLMVDRFVRVEHELRTRNEHLDGYRKRAEMESQLAGMAKARAAMLQAKQLSLLANARGDLGAMLKLRRAAEDPDSTALEARLRMLGAGALPTPPSPRAAIAVAYAIAQLGKPYVFAAAGPDTFDCSGLTMMAWRQAGVSMAHFAATQFQEFPRVSVDALEPGDLVFFYPTVHHVGIYIGGGKMINAPHTGDVVRVASINRLNLVGAVRPG